MKKIRAVIKYFFTGSIPTGSLYDEKDEIYCKYHLSAKDNLRYFKIKYLGSEYIPTISGWFK